jgi:hypothetical protein
VRKQVQTFHGEVYEVAHFFLLADLSIGKIVESSRLRVSLLRLESFELDNQYLGEPIYFKLLMDILLFFALGAIPLICPAK